MGTEPWNRPRQTNRQTERWSWARLLSASLLVPQSEAGTELDQPFQIPKHLSHTKMSSHPFLVPKIRGAEYSCAVPGSLVTGSASRIGCVIRTSSMVSFAQWAHTRSIELSSFCSPPLQEISFSFSFSGALTNQLRVGGILRGVLIRVTGFPWHAGTPWSVLLTSAYRGWLCRSGAAMFSRVMKRLHPTSLNIL